MNKIRTFILWAKGKYEVLAEKKYTTIAGMLVYFLIMSITPFAFWLTLLYPFIYSFRGNERNGRRFDFFDRHDFVFRHKSLLSHASERRAHLFI